ncbi:glycerol-3-phosphate 1-O-acyltransferase PlsY [Phreatobacter stygius]|uniref:Glycerol-3-phosphate acyltransferase n=1 Tax=Phreatobacter stygius TaxID=1940610 RepID=A0A4D7B5B9_9HYPH|nr:glycerol-3-phosphate 1-O-acyltransferase PlsY [Phreatobacter stygius]QCI68584.1 glycerol-3-phosphate 1-O-acyltransferase PlsY [Phreatobacter stygius]
MFDLSFPALLAALAFGYLLGSIPFGLLLTRAAGMGDIRAIGSGNIGATNVLRTGSKKLAAATLLLDALKATAAVLIAARFGPQAALIAGIGAFLGHIFPVWLGFKGGKGVATFLGLLLGLYWPAFLVFALTWLAMAYAFRFSSLAALVASLVAPAFLIALAKLPGLQALLPLPFGSALQMGVATLAVAAAIWAKHHENIAKLMAGTESRIGEKSAAEAP